MHFNPAFISFSFVTTSLLCLATASAAAAKVSADDVKRVQLFVRETPLTVNGKTIMMGSVVQADGTQGYSPNQADGMHVDVTNQLNVPTSIHWHGLSLPNSMDGVAFVTQEPIAPGKTFSYDFPLKETGTYWMHSHYALQEQYLVSAPMIIWSDAERAKADKQFVITLTDFSFTSPEAILQGLRNAPAMDMKTGSKPMPGMQQMPGMQAMPATTQPQVIAQQWDEANSRFVRAMVNAPIANTDVKYDALLANRRTVDDPDVMKVNPGDTVLLRIIAASCETDFFVDTGSLDAELLAVDGQPIQPLRGNFFQLAIAQRIDLRVTIPKAISNTTSSDGSVFPITMQGEGTTLTCGVVLTTGSTSDSAAKSALPKTASMTTAALDNTQEMRLRATAPLVTKKIDRTLPAVLSGTMDGYQWFINGIKYPTRDVLTVKVGERVEMVLTNNTPMGHPMHLHDGAFQVIEIDGKPISGAQRDTIEVPPHSIIKIAFDADNPGIWPFHCHIPYHADSGMCSMLKYEGVETPHWHPEEVPSEKSGL
ncbi:MAG: hypothetical protein RLZZ386_1384 [Planctomycetota bacterium]